ncbi:MAG: NAD(P)-dependent alcohol dehydrogenase [Pacificimonas sp.]
MKTIGYGVEKAGQKLKPLSFDRVDVRAGEVEIDITHCGVCHSDLHQLRDDWENSVYPCIPGHEIVGRVTKVGDGVSKFAEGDIVGVGCMVNSCQTCDPCERGDEQYCEGPKSCTLTYNGPKKPDGTNTYGGYSTGMIVREEFVLRIPDAIDPAEAAPILCAGVTTYSPMKHFGLTSGQTLGVAGIGGLGHMAVQLGKALGAKVVAFTTSPSKEDDIESLGADDVVDMADADAVEAAAQSLDMLIDTIPYPHELDDYLPLMKPNTTMVVVGNMIEFPKFSPAPMVFNRVAISGSLIGGVPVTQEVLDLCAEHDIRPEIRMIKMQDIDAALKRVEAEDIRFRHVIDMASLKDARDIEATDVDAPDRGEVVGRKAA